MIAAPASPDLAGVLVALDLQRVALRIDGERLIARPAEGTTLDAETTALLRASKAQLLEHLALSDQERHRRLCAAYESVLFEVGRQVQAGQADLAGWKVALARYETLSQEGL